MNINHYRENVLQQFLQKRKDHPEESGRKVPVDTNQLATGGIRVVDAPVMVFDIANSQGSMKKLGKKMNIRIGIDFGPIKTEKIGKKAKSQLIITGSPANTAKILEEKGKDLNNFYQNSKICFGYDILYNLSENDIRNSEGSYLYRNIGSLSNTTSYMDKSKPYKIYEYTGRFYVRE